MACVPVNVNAELMVVVVLFGNWMFQPAPQAKLENVAVPKREKVVFDDNVLSVIPL